MKNRVYGSFRLLILLIATGCEPTTAAPAPLSDEEVEDQPEMAGNEEEDPQSEIQRPKSDSSVILTRDAGRDASVDTGMSELLDGSSDPVADAATQSRDAASNAAVDASGAVVPREAGAPIVVAPAVTGNRAIDVPVESMVDRCRNLSPDRVYLRARIERIDLGAIYDFEALNEPCQTETAVRPVIAGLGTVLIAKVSDANIGIATSGIHVPTGQSMNALTTWSYTWINASNSGHQLRLPLTEQLCPSPKLFAVPNSSRFFVECPGRISDEEGQSFVIGASILAVGLDGLILGLLPSGTTPQPMLVLHRRDSRVATTNLEPLYVKAARASGTGFLFVLSSNILSGSPVPDRLYFVDASGVRTERGVYVDLDAAYRSYVGSGGTTDAALDANGVLYDMRSRTFTTNGERGIVSKRTPGVAGVETVYEDPLLPDDPELMPYRLHGLVTGP